MPVQSARKKALVSAQKTLRAASILLFVTHLITSNEPIDLEGLTFLCYYRAKKRFKHILNSRYFAERKCRKSTLASIYEDDLKVSDDGNHWLSDSEFKQKYRCSRDALDKITDKIKSHEVFKKGKRGPSQMPVKYQLMTLLHFLGHEGESNGTQRDQFKISHGRTDKCRDRVVRALTSLRGDYITWPNEQERKTIERRIEEKYFLPNVISMMDGTLLPLAFTPRCDDYADYNGRKYRYSLTVNVINDDRRKIRAYLAGFPGSAHDNRVWKHMQQHQRPWDFFDANQVLLCDTAYEPSDIAIPAYKCQTGYIMPRDQEYFNTCLASPRVITEHTMGLWKGRFPWLRNIRMQITNEKKSLARILMYIDATVVLHNMLIEFGDDKDEELPWNVDDDDMSAMDDETRVPERQILDLPIPGGSSPGTRREQLKNLVSEYFVRKFNFRSAHGLNNTDADDSLSLEESVSDFDLE